MVKTGATVPAAHTAVETKPWTESVVDTLYGCRRSLCNPPAMRVQLSARTAVDLTWPSIAAKHFSQTHKDIELTVSQLVSLIPQGKPYSIEMSGLVGSCFEIAEQIPYTHPSMIKLVTLIDLCLKSSHFDQVDGHAVSVTIDSSVHPHILRADRIRGISIANKSFAKWEEIGGMRGLFGGHVLPIYTIDDAFGEKPGVEQSQDAYARAALNYLMITGDGIYEEVLNGELELKRWQRWLQQANLISKQDKSSVYAQETIDLANQVVVAMEAIQQLKS
ncbi:hypothetical protein MRB53_037258 [Persea americana]|nr:hypothetical protein MRB53_037258 [Persea americana]